MRAWSRASVLDFREWERRGHTYVTKWMMVGEEKEKNRNEAEKSRTRIAARKKWLKKVQRTRDADPQS